MEQRAEEGAALCIQGDSHIEGDSTLEDVVHEREGKVRVLEGDESRGDLERLENGDADCEIDHDHVQDTVGVVVLDQAGNVASTVSSGGIALKQPGRWGNRQESEEENHNTHISGWGKLPVSAVVVGLRSLPGLVQSHQLLSVQLVGGVYFMSQQAECVRGA